MQKDLEYISNYYSRGKFFASMVRPYALQGALTPPVSQMALLMKILYPSGLRTTPDALLEVLAHFLKGGQAEG